MTYPGGKEGAGVYQRIICQMPPHTTYIEGFLGGGAIMRLKRPAVASIGIDTDRDVLLEARSWAGTIPDLLLWQADAIRWLASHTLTRETLVYLDPPYLMQTRLQQRRIYRYEISDADHRRLLAIIVKLPCMVAISGYWSEMYADALKDWRAIQFSATTRGGTTATEWLWMNYPEPLELHDYRYLGDGFRERERIKRKKGRWIARLRGMPTLEKHALMAAIEEMRTTPAATPETAIAPEATPQQARGDMVITTPKTAMVHDLAPSDLPPSWEAPPPRFDSTSEETGQIAQPLLEQDTPDQTIQPGRPTPEMAMQPEFNTPQPTRVHDITPLETVLLDQAAPAVAAIPVPNAECDDGHRHDSPEPARRNGQGLEP